MPHSLFDISSKSQQLHRAETRAWLAGENNALFLHHMIAKEMAERLQMFRRDFRDIAVLRGLGLNWVELLGAKAAQTNVQVFEPPLELGAFPLEPASQDLILAPLWLHWVEDISEMLLALRFALKPGGVLIGSMFGGDCLAELRLCMAEAEECLCGGVSPRFSPSIPLHTLAQLVQKAGFSMPVADSDKHQVRYPSALKLMQDLSDAGESNALTLRSRKVVPYRLFTKTAEIYETRFAHQGGVSVGCEVLHFSGSAT